MPLFMGQTLPCSLLNYNSAPKGCNFCLDFCDIERVFNQLHKTWGWTASLRLNISISRFSYVQQSGLVPRVTSGFFFIRTELDTSSSCPSGGHDSLCGTQGINGGVHFEFTQRWPSIRVTGVDMASLPHCQALITWQAFRSLPPCVNFLLLIPWHIPTRLAT